MPRPKHPKAKVYLSRNLFHGLSNFKELESRIASLATPKERGEAFEVFAEAYLATQPLYQAKEIWPFKAIPYQIKEKFGLGKGADLGIDGIFQTHLDQFSAYQVKFRSGRPSLTWNELSTFMGLTDQIVQRILFTNCNDLPEILNQRSGFYCIRGGDLDRLEPCHFEEILKWLEGVFVPREKKEPFPHQHEALEAIVVGLSRHDRATTVMACGTGKTLVALWVAERLGCRKILVLVPALALLRQTLHEWLRETRWKKVSYLCVCSDPTVEKNIDDLIVKQSDLDFPVSTDSQTVKKFLNTDFHGVKVVFSTYQSARVVADGMDKNKPFELGIFDEAHKTAGREGANFSFALKDENLPISKRLFMTATPRHYDVHRKDKEGDARLVYSMDIPEIYGPISHKLSFAEAARQGIITDYKIVIPIITKEMVTRERLRRGKVVVEGDPIKAQQVANQIALQMAVDKYGVRKVFTFHSTVASARSFTRMGSEGVGTHLAEFQTYHVNGAMPTADRESLMVAFREGSKAVMSNARCLTEGIDVPAVDMVAFLSPKRSKVDIVQATGRAMRKEAGKTTGYVLVPLFVQEAKGESVEGAIQHTRFDEVWNVLQAMQEQDDVLADVIRQMREERGRTKGYDDSRFKEKVDFLGPELTLETLRRTITTACIERLGDTWNERFGELKAFKEKFGHCHVPTNWQNQKLANWARWQREYYKKGFVSKERMDLLEQEGFIWDYKDWKWEEMFNKLSTFKEQHGHCNVPQTWEEDKDLVMWVLSQRQGYRDGWLTQERKRRLTELGFAWKIQATSWEKMLQRLMSFKEKFGDCNVPADWAGDKRLANWVFNQRNRFKNGTLSKKRIYELEKIGFIWSPFEAIWEEKFQKLISYREKYGDCSVPSKWSEDQELSNWVANQRQNYKKKIIDTERIKRLEDIGFAWDVQEAQDIKILERLVAYREHYGHCNVPLRWNKDRQLAIWVCNLRKRFKQDTGSLSKNIFQKLNEIGFVWDLKFDRDEMLFQRLVKFKENYGHCDVPQKWEEDKELGIWVSGLRKRFKDMQKQKSYKRLLPDKFSQKFLEQLLSIGFKFEVYKANDEMNLKKLVAFKEEFGHCNVPQGWERDPSLAIWVRGLRDRYKNRRLEKDFIFKLENLGFAWRPPKGPQKK